MWEAQRLHCRICRDSKDPPGQTEEETQEETGAGAAEGGGTPAAERIPGTEIRRSGETQRGCAAEAAGSKQDGAAAL